MVPPAADSLAAAWDARNAYQRERAACVPPRGWVLLDAGGDAPPVAVVTALDTAVVHWASPVGVHFDCPYGWPTLHVHPPSECNSGATWCALSTAQINAGCLPSDADRRQLRKNGRPFGIVQCSPSTFRFYLPSDGEGS